MLIFNDLLFSIQFYFKFNDTQDIHIVGAIILLISLYLNSRSFKYH